MFSFCFLELQAGLQAKNAKAREALLLLTQPTETNMISKITIQGIIATIIIGTLKFILSQGKDLTPSENW